MRRRAAKLNPHQYKLRFPRQEDFMLPPRQRRQGYVGGSYIRRINGEWYVFRNRWKAHWHVRHGGCACLHAPTMSELAQLIRRSKDGRFAFNPYHRHDF